MDGIDISNYQAGINLAAVPCDFVLVLVSEGGSIVNPYWRRQADQALSLGKLVGLYHYVAGSGAGEVDTFVNATRDYRGRVVMALDWESGQNSQWGNLGYLDMLVKRLKQSVGTVLLYGSSGSYPRQVASANGCPTWVAQYASMSATGYQSTPWNEGAYQANIRQYASSGRLPGWGGSLDLNKYYGDRNQWLAWAGNEDDMALTNDDAEKIAEAVWGYNYKNTATGGNMYNTIGAVLDLVRKLPGDVWTYLWQDKDGNGKPAGGNMYNSIGILHAENAKLQAMVEAQSTAINALAANMGADPEAIAQAVKDSVTAKLNAVQIEMKVSE